MTRLKGCSYFNGIIRERSSHDKSLIVNLALEGGTGK